MGIGTCLSHWMKRVKRSPQLIWPHQLSTSLLGLCLNLEYARFRPCSGFQGGFYSPHRARGRIKDWWELSESVYCSRDPCMCYEWEDCVAVLPHRSSWGRHSTEVFDNQGWIVYPFFFFCTVDSLWIARELWVDNCIFWWEMWWNTCCISKRGFHISTDW